MKKTRFFAGAAALAVLCALYSCANPNLTQSSTTGVSDADSDTTLPANTDKSDKEIVMAIEGTSTTPTVTPFDDGFIRGFDASAVDYYKTTGAVSAWKDTDGTTKDFFAILANHGYDTVRLRIWNDPSQSIVADDTPPAGDNTLERTITMAKSIKAAGLSLMLDFHYSDYWTDPSKQYVPRAWLDAESADDVAGRLAEYTTGVLTALKERADVIPAYVQIGNEINSGMVRDNKTASSTSPDFAFAGQGDTLVKYLFAASAAVRAFDPSIKIMVHVTSSNNPATLLARLKTAELDYDIIGLSYYPWEYTTKNGSTVSAHDTIQQMVKNIQDWKTTYGKDVIIAECSAQFDGDSSDASVSKRYVSALDMIDSGGALYADLETEEVDGKTCLKGSVANAKAVLRHIMQDAFDAKAIGCVAWGGEMHGDWDRAMFDWGGTAMDNIDAFNYAPGKGYPTSGDDGDGDDTTEETMTLTLNFDSGIAASTVQVLYYADGGSSENGTTVTADVVNNTASVTLSNKYAGNWGFNAKITVKDSGGNDISSTVKLDSWSSTSDGGASDAGGDCTKCWFAFKANSTLTVTCTDNSSASEETMTLTLNFDNASTASTVQVLYYADGGNSENGTTVTATVSDNSATVTLSNKYAGTWGFNAAITVKDSGGNDISSGVKLDSWASTDSSGASGAGGDCTKCWFAFKADSTLTVTCTDNSSASEETMTLNLTLVEAIAIPGGSITIHYGADSGTYVDVSADVAADGKSATATLEKQYANTSGWYNGVTIKVKNSSGADVEVASYTTYFEYNSEAGVTINLSAPVTGLTTIYTVDSFSLSDSAAEVVASSGFSDKNITTLVIELANITGNSTDFWVGYSHGSTWGAHLQWDDSVSGCRTVITDTETISKITSDGLSISGSSGASGKLTISYN